MVSEGYTRIKLKGLSALLIRITVQGKKKDHLISLMVELLILGLYRNSGIIFLPHSMWDNNTRTKHQNDLDALLQNSSPVVL